MARLAAVAQGREPADLVVTGGALLDVFTEELLEGWGVAVAAGRVAAIGPEAASLAGPDTERIDLDGGIVAPGLVEGHTHLSRIGLLATMELQVAAGVTTSVVETLEIGYLGGPAAVREVIAEAPAAAGRVFLTVPPLIGLDAGHEASLAPAAEWIELLDDPVVAGVGEIYWADLLRGHPRTEALVEAALARGLAVTGHGAGARLPALNALAGWGVGDDHEGISADDVLNRLRLGLHGFARHGATRQDLPEIASLWHEHGAALGRLSLVTDGVEPPDLVAGHSLNHVVRMAVEHGLPLPTAWRMGSLSVAARFGLDRWLGGLGPAMLADLVVLPRDGDLRPRRVLVGGRPPAAPARSEPPDAWLHSVDMRPFDAALLERPAPGRWRAMELVAPLVTREAETDGRAALPVVCADRRGRSRAFRGLLIGLGLRGGAVALTTGWESAGVTAAGDSRVDLQVALDRVQALQGGAVVAAGGRVVAEWRADVLGVHSSAPVAEVVDQLAAVQGALRSLGCDLPNPLQTVETLTTAAIPHLRITPEGYVRLRDGARLGPRIT